MAAMNMQIRSYRVDGTSRFDALLNIAKEYEWALAIEYVGTALFEPVNIGLTSGDAKQALDALLPPAQGFGVSIDGEIVHIRHNEMSRHEGNMLDTVLDRCIIPEVSLQVASAMVRRDLFRQLNPNDRRGYAFSISGGGTRRVGPHAFEKLSVREILNRIVEGHGHSAWIVQVTPKELVRWRDLLWTVVEYDSRLMERIGALTQERAGLDPKPLYST